MHHQIMPDDLVLTVNQRLAADLRARYDRSQADLGLKAWRSPNIMPFNAWLHTSHAVLTQLSDHHARALWQQVINESDTGSLLICDEQAAASAFEAWRLCVQWQLSDEQLQHYSFDALDAFRQWRDDYLLRLTSEHLGDQTFVSLSALNESPAYLPKRIFLAGFGKLSPLFNGIVDKLKQNSEVLEWQSRSLCAQVSVVGAKDYDSERRAMVDWACTRQDQSIACVVPDINNSHQLIYELFAERGVTANIAAAIPLASYPIVDAARLILQGALQGLDFAEHSALARSPFIKEIPQLAEPCIQSPRTWAKRFALILQDSGWPGTRQLSSAEHQTVNRLKEALREFAQLELIFDRLSPHAALKQWVMLTRASVFQPQAPDCNIQVLGLLEVALLEFEAIWLCGMTDEVLPQPLNPNPYLPVSLQRELGMPRANPQYELQYAKKLIKQLQQSCAELIVSYSQFDGDRPLQVSPLFADFNVTHLPELKPHQYQLATLQRMCDNQAPPVSETEKLRGGTSILKAQSACPFKAFSEIRLRAEPIEEPVPGIDPTERGTWVHEVLQSLWTELQDLAQLLEADLEALVEKHIEQAARNLPDLATYRIERLRLKRLILKWLEYEKQRPPFSVHALESAQDVTLGGLKLTMRLDRLDTLSDGSLAVIDYKTGMADLNSWFTQRPQDPQLPLYCVANQAVKHLTFARVRTNKLGFSGISSNPWLLPDTTPCVKFADDWAELTHNWHLALERLARNFMAGHAEVDPRDGAATCQFCHCYSLCRIYDNGSD